jgi:hypothetical protein
MDAKAIRWKIAPLLLTCTGKAAELRGGCRTGGQRPATGADSVPRGGRMCRVTATAHGDAAGAPAPLAWRKKRRAGETAAANGTAMRRERRSGGREGIGLYPALRGAN